MKYDDDKQQMNKSTLSRQQRVAGTVTFVDGIARTGKSMMGSILASFERVEIERIESIFEYVGALHRLGKLERDAAVTLLKTEADEFLYHTMISRNTNFQFHDHSSVWRNANRMKYFKRIFSKDGPDILERIVQEQPIFQTMTHDQLANLDLHHEAFGDNLRMLQMIRHPIDLVYSWVRRGWGTRFGTDPLALTFCINYEGQDLPYYAAGWESEYVSTQPLGRVIKMITRLWDDNMNVYRSLNAKQKHLVMVIPYEDFLQRPHIFLNPVGLFLGSTPTKHTQSTLKRQGCPRKLSEDGVNQRHAEISSQAMAEEMEDIERLIEEYNILRKESLSNLEVNTE